MHPLVPFLLASRNPGKIREVREILEGHSLTIEAIGELEQFNGQDVEESGETFLENALIKAVWAARLTGRAVLADDSGLEVDPLSGGPGVRSARFSGPEANAARNNIKLVSALSSVPFEDRTARFRCVVVLFVPVPLIGLLPAPKVHVPTVDHLERVAEGVLADLEEGRAVWFTGTLEGRIIDQARGEGGFGYDPHFYLPELDRTVAELPAEQKNTLSHRGQAFRKMARFIAGWMGT